MPASGRLDVHPPPLHSELSVNDLSAVGDEVWAVGMHTAPPAPAVGWIFTGGEMEVFVGSSSRDLRLRALVEVPGHAYELPLTLWSSFREWLAHPVAGPALRRVIEERGGVRGRMGDLLGDPVGRDSVLGNPMVALSQFPGFPINEADAEAILVGRGQAKPA